MNEEIPKTYNPKEHEAGIYKKWEEAGVFTPKVGKNPPGGETLRPFVIAMPPPNVTGKLHMGHALTTAVEDILVRFHRMNGEPTLWIPGTDHAGIATQAVVERYLAKQGKSKKELGREEFTREIWKWKEEYGGTILRQLRTLGASCDWSRERFTLDEGLSKAVREAFVHLYNKGLIYRGDYLVNWCPRCGTAVADDEVEYQTEKGKLWFIKYPLVGNDKSITVATTRPETMLGDTAVAVNPDDSRYKDLVGEKVKLPLTEREISIIVDRAVDKEFGTGAVKVTPAHDKSDWEIGQKHRLPVINVIGEDWRMSEKAGENYVGLKVNEARKKVLEDLKNLNLIEKEQEFEHNVGRCYRCESIIEPLISKQWFVKMKPLAEKAMEAVKSGQIKILPKRFEKVYFHWLENIRDWCISRQLWWGHQIPVWYKGEEIHVGVKAPEGEGWKQDEDVLDTWFSSSLWPFSTLGWPGKGREAGGGRQEANDYEYFYPTTVMETGYDILFFWVARMIMMGLELTGKPPFETVYLHGLVRDESGRKMSKSLGNVLNPEDLIEKYGADALRLSLVVGNSAGNDSKYNESKIQGYRNFTNKIWNAARFVAINSQQSTINNEQLTQKDRKEIQLLQEIIKKVTENMKNFQISQAGEELYEYFWHHFCDKIIEEQKERLKGPEKENAQYLLKTILVACLKMLHPFAPFVTEAIWQEMNLNKKMLISEEWPK